ncbi:unnamed protein product [Ambrosiozyma monospora]|uniref:Unnamed protein product n=1 Tax=Ambrosiozyma monospora TaxID=43982 RepID=A0ACB5T5S6_AMBMO|nr:unnamed protein product [Ambrosiozyma monospora]
MLHTHLVFITNDNSRFIDVPSKITHSLSLVPNLNIKYRPKFDNSLNAGLFQVDLQVGNVIGNSVDVTFVEDAAILNKLDVLKDLKPSGSVLVLGAVDEKFDEEKLVIKILSTKTKQLLAGKRFNLTFLDLNAIGEEEGTKGRTSSIAIQVAFWKLAYPELDVGAIVTKILQAFGSEAELLAAVIAEEVEKIQEIGLKEIKYSEDWLKLELAEEEDVPFVEFMETSFKPNPREAFIDETVVKVENSNQVTKKLIFKEAYGVDTALRPDLPVENFVVKVKENKRLTPAEYSRNIFHIEFDITGTGLKYNIGEALGVHGRNNPELVDQFIELYGLDPNDLVEVVSKENEEIFEIRTLRQALIENIDLLGKPPKRFYESLAEFTKDEKEKAKLVELVSPAGAELLKTFQEEKFYNYIDIFEIFKSARPSPQDLFIC